MAMNLDANGFKSLLEALTSTNRAARNDADAKIMALKRADINLALVFTLNVMITDSNEDFRLQAAVLLRLLLDLSKSGDAPKNTWKSVSAETKDVLKKSLLACLRRETQNSIRSNACDTIADMCDACLELDEWPELTRCTIELIQDENPLYKKSGFKLLGECFTYFADELSPHLSDVVRVTKNSLMDANASVRTETICAISNVLEDDVLDIASQLGDATPYIIGHIKQLAVSTDNASRDELERSMAGLIMIVDNNAKILKPHLQLFFNSMMEIATTDSAQPNLDQEIRSMAIEALVTLAEKKPQTALTIPNFGLRMVVCLMNAMLDIEDDSYAEWLETGETDDDVQRLYDAGEEGLDRLGRAFEDINDAPFMDWVLSNASQFIQQPSWQHVFVGIMTISQTVEYLTEDEVEEHMGSIISIMKGKLKDQDFRVRFAACQTIGQIALDHQPYVQMAYFDEIIPALLDAIEDQSPRVQSHALSAFVNYTEEVQKENLLPLADVIVKQLLNKITPNSHKSVREQAITSLAVVAGVIEEHFVKYYTAVVPLMKQTIATCVDPDDRTCRGKAIECISIIGMTIGRDVFLQDGIECMNALIQIMQEPTTPDDPVKEYADEALGRLCAALGPNFCPFLPTVVPLLLRSLEGNIKSFNEEGDDMTLNMGYDGAAGLRTTLVEELERSLTLIATIVEQMEEGYDDYVVPTAQALMPILGYVLTSELKEKALSAMAQIIKAKRLALEKNGGSKDAFMEIVLNTLNNVISALEKARDDNSQVSMPVEILTANADGLYKCLDSAGPGILNVNIITVVGQKLLQLIEESSNFKKIYSKHRMNKNLDPDEIMSLEMDEENEQAYRSALLELFGVIMKHHPEEFMQTCHNACLQFVLANLEKSNADDIAVGLYLCDNMIEYLKARTVPVWPQFLGHIFKYVESKNANVRQSACYGLSLLARMPEFAGMENEAAAKIAASLKNIFVTSGSTKREQQAATDNAVAALGEIIKFHGSNLKDAAGYLNLWLKNLPLKADEEEGKRVHQGLMDLIRANDQSILGPDNCNMGQLIKIFITIYETDFSTAQLNSQIIMLMKHFGDGFLQQLAPSLPKKLQMQLKTIMRAM
ncbi:karyopherin beta [Babesia ovata]|uniref:Karyopherin beta n=1 Tax=Babesia ovata TaxID=189622 RepID=A0A2H6K9T0_9APIC|nr:karyopherin beta [Babesia ovata]GBE59762.1 karyopherin beta [Babesia ovata]